MPAAVNPAIGLPWYAHPAARPDAWTRLAMLQPHPAFVVVNVSSGPGTPGDPYYPAAMRSISHLTTIGYVDVAYGERTVSDVLKDVEHWMQWYPVSGIMFDQVPSSGQTVRYLGALVDGSRRLGARLVVANPGVVPAADHLELFDVTCVFEGDFTAYRVYRPPAWLLRVPTSRVWHLVYGCAEDVVASVTMRAGDLGAGVLMATSGHGANPWDRLPADSMLGGPDWSFEAVERMLAPTHR